MNMDFFRILENVFSVWFRLNCCPTVPAQPPNVLCLRRAFFQLLYWFSLQPMKVRVPPFLQIFSSHGCLHLVTVVSCFTFVGGSRVGLSALRKLAFLILAIVLLGLCYIYRFESHVAPAPSHHLLPS